MHIACKCICVSSQCTRTGKLLTLGAHAQWRILYSCVCLSVCPYQQLTSEGYLILTVYYSFHVHEVAVKFWVYQLSGNVCARKRAAGWRAKTVLGGTSVRGSPRTTEVGTVGSPQQSLESVEPGSVSATQSQLPVPPVVVRKRSDGSRVGFICESAGCVWCCPLCSRNYHNHVSMTQHLRQYHGVVSLCAVHSAERSLAIWRGKNGARARRRQAARKRFDGTQQCPLKMSLLHVFHLIYHRGMCSKGTFQIHVLLIIYLCVKCTIITCVCTTVISHIYNVSPLHVYILCSGPVESVRSIYEFW